MDTHACELPVLNQTVRAADGGPSEPCQNDPGPGRRILVVSPTKDEAEYLEQTIHSMAWQTLRPARWIIVNDGSRDRSGEIAAAAAATYPWIRVLHRSGDAQRRVGPGVIEAFYAGLETVDLQSFDFVCK